MFRSPWLGIKSEVKGVHCVGQRRKVKPSHNLSGDYDLLFVDLRYGVR